MSIRDAIRAYGSTMGAREFSSDRARTVGASEIGLCARRVCWQKRSKKTVPAAVAKKLPKTRAQKSGDKRGATQDLDNWGAHVRGTTIEQVLWTPALKARFGDDLAMIDQKTLVLGELSATPDGLIKTRGRELLEPLGIKILGTKPVCVVVECKSIDPRVNLVEEKKENAFQVQVQMGLIRELTDYRPDYAVISYVDASFWHDVAEFAVKFSPEDYESAKLRASKIIRAEPQDLRPEGWIAGGRECGWCPWYADCSKLIHGGLPDVEREAKDLDPQFKAELIDLCKQANVAQRDMNEAEKDYKDLQDQIRGRLREKGIKKVPGIVNWFGVKGRTSWDVQAMVAVLEKKKIPTAQFQSTGEPTSSLAVDKKVALL